MGLSMNREILSDWVKMQIAYEGSGRNLGKKLGVDQELLRCWRDKKVNSLTEVSVKKIARYRNETPLQTRAWVAGMSVADFLENELKGLPEHVLVEVFDRIQSL